MKKFIFILILSLPFLNGCTPPYNQTKNYSFELCSEKCEKYAEYMGETYIVGCLTSCLELLKCD